MRKIHTGSRNQFNILSGIIDGNTVYGVEENFARSLRTGYGGLLRMNPVFAQYGLHDLLPLKLDIPDEGCTRPNKSMYCFDAGESVVKIYLLACPHIASPVSVVLLKYILIRKWVVLALRKW